MGLDYDYTCPDINSSIKDLKSDIQYILRDLSNEICPILSSETLKEISTGYAASIYDIIESYIEDIRQTNSDLRSSAEKQINNLEDEIDNLKDEVKSLKDEIETLEDKISDMLSC
jgi:wobble nucleotide-excising tRNase